MRIFMATHVAQLPILSRCSSITQGMMMRPFYVYILASQRNGTLYVSATSDLIKRTWEHKNIFIPGFTAKYNLHMLVYYEMHETYVEPARREKRFKNWPRLWTLNLIETMNPVWDDLYEKFALNSASSWMPRSSRGT